MDCPGEFQIHHLSQPQFSGLKAELTVLQCTKLWPRWCARSEIVYEIGVVGRMEVRRYQSGHGDRMKYIVSSTDNSGGGG